MLRCHLQTTTNCGSTHKKTWFFSLSGIIHQQLVASSTLAIFTGWRYSTVLNSIFCPSDFNAGPVLSQNASVMLPGLLLMTRTVNIFPPCCTETQKYTSAVKVASLTKKHRRPKSNVHHSELKMFAASFTIQTHTALYITTV